MSSPGCKLSYPEGACKDIGYSTRFQARRGSPHPFQGQSALSGRSLNIVKQSFQNVTNDDWNSLPELLFVRELRGVIPLNVSRVDCMK